jgi:uncharacterized membrane protein YkoI
MGVGALGALALGGSQLAGAASTTTTPNGSASGSAAAGQPPRSNETVLTGTTADQVKAAILAKLPGATIQRMSDETDGNGTDAYEAHVTKSDGTHVQVLLDKSFAVTSVKSDTFGGRHRGGPGGRGGSGETPLTGDTLSSVKSAVAAKLPGSTVEMASTENDGKSTDAYEAHVTKSDGTHVKVLLDKSFAVTAVNDEPGHLMGG